MTVLEERDLVAEFGIPYADYPRKLPMLIPWHGPRGQAAATREAAARPA